MPKNIGHQARFKEKEHLSRHRAWLEGNFFRCVRARARLRALMTRLHCTFLLRTIFASSARAHGRVHVQNVRDFPQSKLDSEINSPFLLNEHGDPRVFFFSGIC